MIVDPRSQTIAIEVKSQPGRHTINRAKLVAIYITIEQNKDIPQLKILTNNAVGINAIRSYLTAPLASENHPHNDILHHINIIIRQRDDLRLLIYIAKVKSHTDIQYNNKADLIARDVVDNRILP